MADNEFAGSALYAHWIWSGGTVVLSTESRNFSYTASIDYIDATAGADATRRRLASFKDATVSLSMVAQTDGTALIASCAEGNNGTLIFGEAGTATNSPKTTLPCRANGVSRSVPYADVVTYDITWSANGDPTYGAY
jgi:hypothetical protein